MSTSEHTLITRAQFEYVEREFLALRSIFSAELVELTWMSGGQQVRMAGKDIMAIEPDIIYDIIKAEPSPAPAPSYRPFTLEEFVSEMQGTPCWVKVKDSSRYKMITQCTTDAVDADDDSLTWAEALNEWEFLNGSPFGIKGC